MKDITDTTFEQEVLQADSPILVDFWAPWCGPCKMLTPILEKLENEIGQQVKIVKINIDEQPETPTKFFVRSIPTLMLFKDGQQVASKTGLSTKEILKKWLDEKMN